MHPSEIAGNILQWIWQNAGFLLLLGPCGAILMAIRSLFSRDKTGTSQDIQLRSTSPLPMDRPLARRPFLCARYACGTHEEGLKSAADEIQRLLYLFDGSPRIQLVANELETARKVGRLLRPHKGYSFDRFEVKEESPTHVVFTGGKVEAVMLSEARFRECDIRIVLGSNITSETVKLLMLDQTSSNA